MPGNDAQGPSSTGEPLARGFDAWWSAEPIAGAAPPQRLTQWHHPPRDRRRSRWLLALVLVGHVLVIAWVTWGAPVRPVVQGQALEVTFYETAPLPPPPPPLLPPPPLPGAPLPPPVRIHHPVPRAPGSITATIEPPPRQLDLYGQNGQIQMSNGGPPASAPAYRAVMPEGDQVLTIKTPLHYKPTRFNEAWAPVNETNGRKLLNKMIDKTTVKKTVKLPTGDRVTCAVNPLLALAGGLFGCHGEIPPPPPKNDHDIRLSLPPAETLTGKKVVVPSSASSVPPPSAPGG